MAPTSPKALYQPGYSQQVINALQKRTPATDAAHLLPHLKPTSTILDIGCGPGGITVGLAQVAFKGCVIGVDISSVSLALAEKHAEDVRAQARAAPAGPASQPRQLGEIRFLELDVLQGLPFEDACFDAVYSGQTLVHLLSADGRMTRATAVVREIRRVLRPGGVVATRDVSGYHWFPSSHTEGRGVLFEKMVKAIIGTARPRGGDVPIIFRRAGFETEKMTISASTRVISSREKREWFGRIALQRMEGPGRKEAFMKDGSTEDEFEEVKAALQRWIDDEDAWHAGVHTDILAFK